MAGPIITLIFSGDASRLNRAAAEAGDSTSKVSKSFDKLKGQADIASGAILAGAVVAAKAFTDAAAEQEQALGGLESVFKGNAGQVKAWADNAANAVGLSKTAYASLAAPIGAALKGAGMSLDEATTKTGQLITVGADLAATFGGSTSEAVGALSSALRGEFDPLERFGIALTADGISAEMAARGLDKLTGSAEATAKKSVTMDLIMKGAADSTGQFAKEADTAAGAAERQAAKFEDMKAKLGAELLPALTAVTGKLTEFTNWASENTGTVLAIAGALTAMAAAYVAVRVATAAWQTVVAIATVAQWAWNVALSANPIGLVIIAVAAFIAALVLLWQNNEVVREKLGQAWEWIKSAFGSAVSWIGDKIGQLLGWFKEMPGRIGDLLSGLVGIILWPYKTAFNAISDAWNNSVGRLSWTVPGWVPVIGGNTISAPKLPKFHSGGVVPGQHGSEMLAILQAGERVIPAGAPAGGGTEVRFVGNTDNALATVIMRLVREGKIQLVQAA